MKNCSIVLLLTVLTTVFSIIVGKLLPEWNLRDKSSPADYDVYQFSPSTSSELTWYQRSGIIHSTGRLFVSHVALFNPNYFSFYPPTMDGCTDYTHTSASSNSTWNCDYATNGGFFTFDTTVANRCIGNLVSDEKVWQTGGNSNANLGITVANEVVLGYLDDSSYSKLQFKELMSGVGWLVRNGVSYVDKATDVNVDSSFVTEKAPRTSVGIFSNGTMLLFEVDGEEDINYGPDLFEMAELLVDLGVESAINIDGGGSSVSVFQGQVISRPTCNDTPEVCERSVQSITCVRK